MSTATVTTQIGEFIVGASIEELNMALAERNLGAEQIVTVIFLPEAALAIGDAQAKFRVLYKAKA